MHQALIGWRKTLLVAILLALIIAAIWQYASYRSSVGQLGASFRDYLDIRFWCPFGCGQSFNVDFVNKASDCIIFPSDYGLRVFVNKFGIWSPTEFSLKHLNFGSNHPPVSDSIKLGPNKGDGWLMSIASTVFPGNTIRVVLQGTTCSHGATSGENFADYADLTITADNLRGP